MDNLWGWVLSFHLVVWDTEHGPSGLVASRVINWATLTMNACILFCLYFTHSPFTMSLGLPIRTGESLQEAWSWVLQLFSLFRLSVYFQWGLESFHIQDHYGMWSFIVLICSYFIYHLLIFFFMIFICDYLVFLNVSFWFINLQFACVLFWFKIFYSYNLFFKLWTMFTFLFCITPNFAANIYFKE